VDLGYLRGNLGGRVKNGILGPNWDILGVTIFTPVGKNISREKERSML
jgi:hypothetical protein